MSLKPANRTPQSYIMCFTHMDWELTAHSRGGGTDGTSLVADQKFSSDPLGAVRTIDLSKSDGFGCLPLHKYVRQSHQLGHWRQRDVCDAWIHRSGPRI